MLYLAQTGLFSMLLVVFSISMCANIYTYSSTVTISTVREHKIKGTAHALMQYLMY